MLHLFIGPDRKAAHKKMSADIAKAARSGFRTVRITDANSIEDVRAALAGGGMFAQARVVVLDGTLADDAMRAEISASLAIMANSVEHFFMYEEKPDAVTRRLLEKHAASSEKFDAARGREEGNVFAIANALRRGEKKALWITLQRDLAAGKAPEAIHGILFWGAKDMVLKARNDNERARACSLVALLTELPHAARRRGEDLEYALERFSLSGT